MTVLCWISVIVVNPISVIPFSVFSDTISSNELNSLLGGKLGTEEKKNTKYSLPYDTEK